MRIHLKTTFIGLIAIGTALFAGTGASYGAEEAPAFASKTMTFEAGINEINNTTPWDGVSLFQPDGEVLPEIRYEMESGGWAVWETAHTHGTEISDMLKLVTFREQRERLLVWVGSPVTVTAHFYASAPEETKTTVTKGPLSFVTTTADKRGQPRFVSRDEWLNGITTEDPTMFDVWQHSRAAEDSQKAIVRAKIRQAEDVDYSDYSGENVHFDTSRYNDRAQITVHHTVTPQRNISDPFATMRSIYMFHTFTRGWGDIGYHYVISPDGLVFEGSKGGPTKSGTHVANRNADNIGISLMGNFEIEEPTEVQLEVLSLLIADHALRFGLDPERETEFFGTPVYEVAGHRDIATRQYPTACPGNHLYKKLPDVRTRSKDVMKLLTTPAGGQITARDFLAKSELAPKIQGRKLKLGQEREIPIAMGTIAKTHIATRGKKGTLDLVLKNNTKTEWPQGVALLSEGPEGMLLTDFYSMEPIAPGKKGTFRAKYLVKTTPNGKYFITLTEDFLHLTDAFADRQQPLRFEIQVSGDKDFVLNNTTTALSPAQYLQASAVRAPVAITASDVPEIKIKLDFFKERYGSFKASTPMHIYAGDTHVHTVAAGETVKVLPLYSKDDGRTRLQVSAGDWTRDMGEISLVTEKDGFITIENYRRGLGASHAYNEFRNRLNVHIDGRESLLVVNQLPIDLYLRGLSEQPSDQPTEKKHAIHVLGRSYAWVYSQTDKRKFGTTLFDLDDNPAHSQYYLGHEWERYHADQTALLEETRGEVIAVNEVPVIGPYYSCSGGWSKDSWRSQYPHTKAQYLPWDENCTAAGHGIGLSGWSAKALAEDGYAYREILDFFYDGIDIQKVY